jgi:hypothetical protein
LTFSIGLEFSLVIDSVTRVRWRSSRLAEMLTLHERDCAVLVWLLDGWAAVLVEGWVPALVFVLVSLGDACVRLFAGGAVLVCAWDDEFGCWAD